MNGNQADAEFAGGFLSAVGSAVAVKPSLEHWRPTADLESPFGRVQGDLGFFVGDGASGVTLVIVEREGSAPGNERNALKWYTALRGAREVYLRRDGKNATGSYDTVLLWMAFGRSRSWGRSDFEKTVGFCGLLARILSHPAGDLGPDLRIIVQAVSSDEVDDWREVGREQGNALLRELHGG